MCCTSMGHLYHVAREPGAMQLRLFDQGAEPLEDVKRNAQTSTDIEE